MARINADGFIIRRRNRLVAARMQDDVVEKYEG